MSVEVIASQSCVVFREHRALPLLLSCIRQQVTDWLGLLVCLFDCEQYHKKVSCK